MPFGKGKSYELSVTVAEHNKGCKFATRKVCQMTGGVKDIREVSQLMERCDG